MDIVAHPHLELAVVALDGDIEHGGDRLPDDRPANGTTR